MDLLTGCNVSGGQLRVSFSNGTHCILRPLGKLTEADRVRVESTRPVFLMPSNNTVH
jgi:hypothetical protein